MLTGQAPISWDELPLVLSVEQAAKVVGWGTGPSTTWRGLPDSPWCASDGLYAYHVMRFASG